MRPQANSEFLLHMNDGLPARRFILCRTWIQIALALALIAVQGAILFEISKSARSNSDLIYNTAIICSICTVVGVYLRKNVGRYPGVDGFSHIITSFCISYLALAIFVVLLRVHYSRILLTSSFSINLIYFVLLDAFLRRRAKISIGLVPAGEIGSLLAVSGINWTILKNPGIDVAGLDAISVDLRSDLSDDWERRLALFALQNIPVYHSKHLLESVTGKVEIEHLSENSFGTLSPLAAYMAVKFVVDTLAAAITVILLSPLLLLIGLCIVLDSPGPALFTQIRIGHRGKPFRVYKFRTMTAAPEQNKDDAAAIEQAMTRDGDQRITRLGAFLRRTRLDELPQLLNVLKGEMSWIGPRPEARILSQWYEKEIPFYRYRHIVRPGITGWAQVNQGHVAEVAEVESKLYFDFYYIKNFSPWIDLLIVLRTIKTILTGFGAK